MTEGSPTMTTPLTPASAKLIRDWDRYPDAIDASELSARLWLIEQEAALRTPTPADPPTGFRPGMTFGNGGNVLPPLPLNDSNGPWCGCGQRLGHAVSNVDCTVPDRPAEPGLREALDAMERDLRFLVGDVDDIWATWARVRAALATTPDALDVERLARAICASQERCDGTCPDFEGVAAIHHRDAASFAAEYARLALAARRREDRS